jgi:hypothetical protein
MIFSTDGPYHAPKVSVYGGLKMYSCSEVNKIIFFYGKEDKDNKNCLINI